jgi:hypothetical protein
LTKFSDFEGSIELQGMIRFNGDRRAVDGLAAIKRIEFEIEAVVAIISSNENTKRVVGSWIQFNINSPASINRTDFSHEIVGTNSVRLLDVVIKAQNQFLVLMKSVQASI